MAKQTISITKGAIGRLLPFQDGFLVETTDGAVVDMNQQAHQVALGANAGRIDSSPSIPLPGGYISDLAIKLLDREQVRDGILINTITGKPVFPSVAVAPLPKKVKNDTTLDGIAALQQFKFDNPLFKQGIDVDGDSSKVQYAGDTEPHARYNSEIEPGYLVLEENTAAPPANVIVVPAGTERGQVVLMHGWSKVAMQIATKGLNREEVMNYLDVPADQPVTKSENDLGRLKVVQVGGNNFRINRKFVRNGTVETDWDPMPANTLDFTIAIGRGVPADLRFYPGEKNLLPVRNEDGGTDLLLIWTPPK